MRGKTFPKQKRERGQQQNMLVGLHFDSFLPSHINTEQNPKAHLALANSLFLPSCADTAAEWFGSVARIVF